MSKPSFIKRFIGALTSKNKAAYLGLVYMSIKPITRFIDQFFQPEKKNNSDKVPLFIVVGPPRSGTTLFYQYAVRYINIAYPSNLHFLFPSLGSKFYNWLNIIPSNWKSFKNYYGHTSRLGEVNEANYFFKNLKLDDDIHNMNLLTSFRKSISNNKMAIISKSVEAFKYIDCLQRIDPNIIFIRVSRNESQNIQSELAAYYELGTFNPIPQSLSHIDYTQKPVHFAAQLIKTINRDIKYDLSNLHKTSNFNVLYEDFCQSPNEILDNVFSYHFNKKDNSTFWRQFSVPLKASSRKKVSDNDLKIIESELENQKL